MTDDISAKLRAQALPPNTVIEAIRLLHQRYPYWIASDEQVMRTSQWIDFVEPLIRLGQSAGRERQQGLIQQFSEKSDEAIHNANFYALNTTKAAALTAEYWRGISAAFRECADELESTR